MKTINYKKVANLTTLLSFLIGTGLFAYYKLTNDFNIVGIELLYVITTFIINILILFTVFLAAIMNQENRNELLLHGALMLL